MKLNRRDFLKSSGALLGTAVLGEEISTLATQKGGVAEAAEPAPVYEIYALKYAGPFTRKLANVLYGRGWDENIEVNYYLWAIKGQDGFIVVDTGWVRGVRGGLGKLDNMEQFLSDKLPWFMPLPGS